MFLRIDIEIVPESILEIIHTKLVQISLMEICCVQLSGVRPGGKQ